MVLAAPSVAAAASHGEGAFLWILRQVLPGPLAISLIVGIVVAQYLCGLATVTSASRMAYAFARDGGVPFSRRCAGSARAGDLRPWRIWTVSAAAVLFTLYTPVYSTITAVCTILLYLSYVLPTVLGARAHGRTWTTMGPWHLGRWFRPLAWTSVAGCLALIAIGMQPPNERSIWVVGGMSRRAWPGLDRRRAVSVPGTAAPAYDRHDVPASRLDPDNERGLRGRHCMEAHESRLATSTRRRPALDLVRAHTPARILTGRAGGSYRTETCSSCAATTPRRVTRSPPSST